MNNTQATTPSNWYEIQNHSLTLRTGLGKRKPHSLIPCPLPSLILTFEAQSSWEWWHWEDPKQQTHVRRDRIPGRSAPALSGAQRLYIYMGELEKNQIHTAGDQITLGHTYVMETSTRTVKSAGSFPSFWSWAIQKGKLPNGERIDSKRHGTAGAQPALMPLLINKDTAVSGGGFKPHRTARQVAGGFVASTERLRGFLMAAEKAKQGHPS